jgi:hypothetical protein
VGVAVEELIAVVLRQALAVVADLLLRRLLAWLVPSRAEMAPAAG